ncbi:hypothetical protein Pmani_027420 [Petrolisthes manimaculis]|uniref:Retinol dehydrogenase 11 n=1 Tax=Petrolisthes manimaculis TaxID=1843537 RepID=A0AAE1TWI3_9EUCA|nr:hypothetical protein Pmani_027420 [Petrolisthes manimaculis]
MPSGRCTSTRSLQGLTAIITGASSGIGKVTARDLAGRGARVILACRNKVKAKEVADEIIKVTDNQEVVVRQLDTSDLQSVRLFAREVLQTETNIHILVNNAGIAAPMERHLSKDGFELTMATNYYGHFLLTNLLLRRLMESAPSRIINVSSVAHFFAWKPDVKDLNFNNKYYNSLLAYSQSKLCNILFTQELAEKLRGSGVTANSLHPGAVATDIFIKGEVSQSWLSRFTTRVLDFIIKLIGKSVESGAQTSIYLAVSEEVEGVTGKYFTNCKETWCSLIARDLSAARALWEVSEVDVNLRPAEIFY